MTETLHHIHAVPFHARHGFQPEGEVYLEAGISHLAMMFSFEEIR